MQAPNAFQFYPPTAAGPPSLTQWVPEPRPVEELQSKFNHNLDYAAGGYSPPPSSLPPSAQYQQLGPPSQQQQQQQQGYAPPPQMQGMKGYGLTSPMRPGPTSTPPYAQAPLPPPNEALPYDVQQFYPQTDQNPRGLPPPTQPNIGYPHQQPAWQDSQYKLSPYPTAAGPFPPSALQEPKGKPNLWQSSPSKANPPLPSSGPDLLSEADARRAREMADDQAAMESTCGPLYNHPNLPYSILSLTVNKSDPLRDDADLLSPVIRLHIVDPATGLHLSSQGGQALGGPQTLDPTSQAYINTFPGRPHQMTINHGGLAVPAIQGTIPPIQTLPSDLATRNEAGIVGTWEKEPLLVDEPIERLVAMDALLLLEVLQPAATFDHYDSRKTNGGYRRIAWAFLRVQGPNRGPLIGRLKLQLYEYKSLALFGSGSKPPHGMEGQSTPFYAYNSWRAMMGGGGPGKYPSALHVTVEAVKRPRASVMTTIPLIDQRPMLPAGYGSGFEQGSTSVELLLGRDAEGKVHQINRCGLAAMMGWDVPTQEEVSRLPNYRRLGESSMLPNTEAFRFKSGPMGATSISFSHSGIALAASCADTNNVFRILIWSLVGDVDGPIARISRAHNEYVYSIAWSNEDDALLTCSSDGTAKVWELNQYTRASKLIRPMTLRHPCYVYSAEFHPNQSGKWPVVATGAYDGLVRLFSRSSGELLVSLHPSPPPNLSSSVSKVLGIKTPYGVNSHSVNTLIFDSLGTRIYAGGSSGLIYELLFDSSAFQDDRPQLELSSPGKRVSHLDRALRHLRTCDEFVGESITHLSLHPSGGRKLGVLTRGSSGNKSRSLPSRLSLLDIKSFLVSAELGPQGGGGATGSAPKCKGEPARAAFSSDGAFALCGSEDGRVYAWDAESGGLPNQLGRLYGLGGEMVYSLAWNPVLNMVALCGYSSWSPVLVLSYDSSQPTLMRVTSSTSRSKSNHVTPKKHDSGARFELPSKLTPEMVRGLLSDVRRDAVRRSIIPEGGKLVVSNSAPLAPAPPPPPGILYPVGVIPSQGWAMGAGGDGSGLTFSPHPPSYHYMPPPAPPMTIEEQQRMAAHQAFVLQDQTPTLPINRYDPSINQLVQSAPMIDPPRDVKKHAAITTPPSSSDPVSSPQRYYGPYQQYSAFTDEEAARLLAHGGTTRKIAGPGSTVLAGPGTTVILTPGSQLYDARSKAEKEKQERLHSSHEDLKPMKLESMVSGHKLESDSIAPGAQPFKPKAPTMSDPPSPTASVAGSKTSVGGMKGADLKGANLKVAGFSDPPPPPPSSQKSFGSVRDASEIDEDAEEATLSRRAAPIPQRDKHVVTQLIYKSDEAHTMPDGGTFLAHN